MIKLLTQTLVKSTNSALEVFAPLSDKLFYFPGDTADFLPPGADVSNVEKSMLLNSLGQKMSIWHLKAKNPIARIIHCHGSGFNVSSHYPHVSWLPENGYEVIMFDYPGYGDSEGTPNRSSTVRAAYEVISHFSKNAPSGLPVFVLGQSLGGNIAAVALTDSPALEGVTGVIFDGMYSSFKALGAAKIQRKYFSKSTFFARLAGRFAAQLAGSLISDSHSPLSRAEKLKLPTLILHSRNDGMVPYKESLNFYNQMTSADVEFWSHMNSGHNDVLQYDLDGYRSKVISWMASKAHRAPK